MNKKRGQLRPNQFAFRKDGKERIDDAAHVRNAIARFRQVKDVSDEERDAAWALIKKAAKRFGVKLSEDSWRDLKGCGVSLQAMSVAVSLPISNAPNRHPFEGVLCVLDEPSTLAPHGANGKRVILRRELADKILHTLIGQAVDWKPSLDGHDTQCKVGVILTAETRDDEVIGKPVIAVSGILYDYDFPELLPALRKNTGDMGMSFELGAAFIDGPTEDTAIIIDSDGFTGAALLLKRDAAYFKTRLAASAAKKGTNPMTEEEMKALLASSLGAFQTSIMTEVKSAIRAAGKKSGRDAFNDDFKDLSEMHAKAGKLHGELMDAVKADDGDVEGAAEELGDHLKAAHAHVKAMKADADEYFIPEGKPAGKADEDETEGKGKKKTEASADVKELETKLKAQADELASLKIRIEGAGRDANEPNRKTVHPALSILIAKGDLKIKASKDGGDERPTESEVRAALKVAGITDQQQVFASLSAARADD